jgi:hypothetical protein
MKTWSQSHPKGVLCGTQLPITLTALMNMTWKLFARHGSLTEHNITICTLYYQVKRNYTVLLTM